MGEWVRFGMAASLGSQTVAGVGRFSPPALSTKNRREFFELLQNRPCNLCGENSNSLRAFVAKNKRLLLHLSGGHRSSSYGIFRSASTGTAGEGSQLGNTEKDRLIVCCRYWLLAVSAGGHALPRI